LFRGLLTQALTEKNWRKTEKNWDIRGTSCLAAVPAGFLSAGLDYSLSQ
jgi:hypothetical protein